MKKLFALMLAFCLVLTMLPAPAFAEGEPEAPVCTCETACAAEKKNTECPVCGAEDATPEKCGKYVVPEPTAAQKVQSLIDVLPDVVTAENREAVEAQLDAIDAAKAPLTEEERATLDFAKYDAAIAAINVLDDMAGAEEPKTLESSSVADATVTVTKTFTYNGDPQTITAADVTVTLGGATLTADTDYTLTSDSQTNAGDYSFTITGIGNYSGTVSGTWAIERASHSDVKFTINTGEKDKLVFDPSYAFPADIGAVTYDEFASPFADITFAGLSMTIYFKDEGTFSYKVHSQNYSDITVCVELHSYEKPEASLDISMPDSAYDGTPKYLDYLPRCAQYYNFTITYYKVDDSTPLSSAPVNAGNYKVVVSYEDNENIYTGSALFAITASNNYSVDFNTGKVDEWGNPILELTYGQTYTLAPTGKFDKFVYSVERGTDVISVDKNTGKITTLKSGDAEIQADNEKGNYVLFTGGLSVSVSKAPVTVTAKDQTAYVGDAAPDLTDAYTLSGLVGDDTLNGTISLSYADGLDMNKPGEYAINVTYTGTDDRYNVTTVPGTLTVLPQPTYTVHFDANGGTGTMADQAMTYDQPDNLQTNSFTRTGYTFTGWNTKADGKGTGYANEAEVSHLTVNGAVTLYAQWRANTYTVRFDANGGEGTMADQTMTYGQAAKLTVNAFALDGHIFRGWKLDPENTDAAYADGATVQDLSTEDEAVITLFAQWELIVDQVNLTLSGHELDKRVDGVKLTSEEHITFTGAYGSAWGIATNKNTLKTLEGKLFRADTQYYLWVIFSPEEGCTLEGLTAKDVTLDGNAALSLEDMQGSKMALFRLPVIYTITVTAGKNGSVSSDNTISAKGVITVFEGEDVTIKITPDSGYVVYRLTVDGQSVKTARTYTFENIQQSHTLRARFLKNGTNAKTGDSFPLVPAIAVLTLSAAALAAIFVIAKKKKKK